MKQIYRDVTVLSLVSVLATAPAFAQAPAQASSPSTATAQAATGELAFAYAVPPPYWYFDRPAAPLSPYAGQPTASLSPDAGQPYGYDPQLAALPYAGQTNAYATQPAAPVSRTTRRYGYADYPAPVRGAHPCLPAIMCR